MPEHSPEPWRLERREASREEYTALVDDHGMTILHGCTIGKSEDIAVACWDQDDMDRIIACVNACRGIPTEVLSQPEMNRTLVALTTEFGKKAAAAMENQLRGLNPEVVPELVGMIKELNGALSDLLNGVLLYCGGESNVYVVDHRGENATAAIKKARELLARVRTA